MVEGKGEGDIVMVKWECNEKEIRGENSKSKNEEVESEAGRTKPNSVINCEHVSV